MRPTPTFGWRCWLVVAGGFLASTYYNTGPGGCVWDDGPTHRAQCDKCRNPPTPQCSCGLYFTESVRAAAGFLLDHLPKGIDRFVLAAGTVTAAPPTFEAPAWQDRRGSSRPSWRCAAQTVTGTLYLSKPLPAAVMQQMANRYGVRVAGGGHLSPREFLSRL
jgi:hypothetical protein